MDYNIYVHADNATTTSPTAPWVGGSTPQTTPWEAQADVGNIGGELTSGAQKVAGLMTANNLTSIGGTGGIMGFLKANPYIAAVMIVAAAVIKTTDKIITFTTDTKALALGDYSKQTEYNNFKASTNALFHPISTALNRMRFDFEINRKNQKAALERELLGDSFINQYTGRGV